MAPTGLVGVGLSCSEPFPFLLSQLKLGQSRFRPGQKDSSPPSLSFSTWNVEPELNPSYIGRVLTWELSLDPRGEGGSPQHWTGQISLWAPR